MRVRRIVVTAAVGALLATVGVMAGRTTGGAAPVPAGPKPAAPTTTTTTASPSGTVILTNADDGTTVVATVGDKVVVRLAGGTLRWSTAEVTPAPSTVGAVLVRVSGGVTTTGSSTTTFRVVGHGLAVLEATATPACAGGAGCPTFVLLWHATVSVPVVDPPGTPPVTRSGP